MLLAGCAGNVAGNVARAKELCGEAYRQGALTVHLGILNAAERKVARVKELWEEVLGSDAMDVAVGPDPSLIRVDRSPQ